MFARIGYSRQKELSRRSDERIAELEFAGGFAEERAAQLAKDAAEARRETEQLKKEVAWREFNSRTAAKLVAELSKFPSRVTLVFISGDPETTQYCVHFRAAFVRAKWETEVVGRTYMGSPVGVFVTHGKLEYGHPGRSRSASVGHHQCRYSDCSRRCRWRSGSNQISDRNK